MLYKVKAKRVDHIVVTQRTAFPSECEDLKKSHPISSNNSDRSCSLSSPSSDGSGFFKALCLSSSLSGLAIGPGANDDNEFRPCYRYGTRRSAYITTWKHPCSFGEMAARPRPSDSLTRVQVGDREILEGNI